MPAQSSIIQTGCCGIAEAQAAYFKHYPCVEIDSSFYQLPKLATAARWRAAAPPGFQFCLKAWQLITHRASSPTYKNTKIDSHDAKLCGHFGFNATVRWAWDETFAVAQELQASVVVFQCAASFSQSRDHIANLKCFFEKAKRGKLAFGWEPRGKWEAEEIQSLCRELDLIHVIDPFKTPPPVPGRIQYFRLHGLTGTNHKFTDEELGRLREFCREKPKSYCLFNNVSMLRDARRFMAIAAPRSHTQ